MLICAADLLDIMEKVLKNTWTKTVVKTSEWKEKLWKDAEKTIF